MTHKVLWGNSFGGSPQQPFFIGRGKTSSQPGRFTDFRGSAASKSSGLAATGSQEMDGGDGQTFHFYLCLTDHVWQALELK